MAKYKVLYSCLKLWYALHRVYLWLFLITLNYICGQKHISNKKYKNNEEMSLATFSRYISYVNDLLYNPNIYPCIYAM